MSEPCQLATALYGVVAVLMLFFGLGYTGYRIGRSDREWARRTDDRNEPS